MKKILFILALIIAFIAFVFPIKEIDLKEKPRLYVKELPYLGNTSDFNWRVTKEVGSQNSLKINTPLLPMKEGAVEKPVISFKNCTKSVATPDALSKMLSQKQAGSDSSHSILNSWDCGVIESVIPFSF